mgnify:CR=1 FL=1
MCLSDAYEIKDGKQNLVCSRVCNVSADGENVTLTDLMGTVSYTHLTLPTT